jgi:hypothetical protein
MQQVISCANSFARVFLVAAADCLFILYSAAKRL